MLTLRPGDPVPPGSRFVAAIGNFDGVHAGHRYLLGRVGEAARQRSLRSLAVTFWPHPRALLQPERWQGYLATLPERLDLLAQCGLDATLVLPFTQEMASRTPAEFVSLLVSMVPLAELWVGEDFRFGNRRAGDVVTLRVLAADAGVAVQTIARQGTASQEVSSGATRALLRDGAVDAAAVLLGRPYRLGGTVVPGDRRGRQLGYPTANIAPDPGKIVPARGIYATQARWGTRTGPSAVSIGIRPQFDGVVELVEAYLLDVAEDLYGQRLDLDFLTRLRDESRFESIEALLAQMARDVEQVRLVTESAGSAGAKAGGN